MAEARLHPGDRIVFLGDSITADRHGHVALVREALRLGLPGVEVVNAGVPGNTAADLPARFETDVLAQAPTWVSLSVGGNDAVRGVSPAAYERAMQAVVAASQSAQVEVALCTPTPFEAQFANASAEAVNARLAQYSERVARLAEASSALLVPMFETFRLVQEGNAPDDEARLTSDGAHMSPRGRYLMGLTWLAAFRVAMAAHDTGQGSG
jgi:acetyl esterase/acyl-CoA thioesterase-1